MANFNNFFLLLACFASLNIFCGPKTRGPEFDAFYKEIINFEDKKTGSSKNVYYRCLCCSEYIQRGRAYRHFLFKSGVTEPSYQKHTGKIEELRASGRHARVLEVLDSDREKMHEHFKARAKAERAEKIAAAVVGGGKVRKRAGGGTARAGAGSAV